MMGISSGISTGRHQVHCVPIELEFTNVDIQGEGKPEYPQEKPLRAKTRTNKKLNPHMTPNLALSPQRHPCSPSAHKKDSQLNAKDLP